MPSSWEWSSNDEFVKYVRPHALNDVDHVLRSRTFSSFAQRALECFGARAELIVDVEKLRVLLKAKKFDLVEAIDVAIDLCHNGESFLLMQRGLAIGMGAYGFLHAKESIQHDAHEVSKPTNRRHLERFVKDVDEMLAAFDLAIDADTQFLMDETDKLPLELRADFIMAKDLCSIGFEEVAPFLCSRGFERVVRKIMADCNVEMLTGDKLRKEPATDADLADIIQIMGRMKWLDSSPVFGKRTTSLMTYARHVRNASAHPSDEFDGTDERRGSNLLAQIAQSVWKTHELRRLEPILESQFRRNW